MPGSTCWMNHRRRGPGGAGLHPEHHPHQLQPGRSVIISTHLIEDVEPVLDEAVFLKNGRIFAHRSVDELRETEGMSVDAYFREVFKC